MLIFSKTWRSDPSQLLLIDKCQKRHKKFFEQNCHEDIDIPLLTKLFDVQKQIKEGGGEMANWLIIFDDQISDSSLKDKRLVDLYCLGRHFGISSIMSLQSYRSSMSAVCRCQMSIIAIGRLASTK